MRYQQFPVPTDDLDPEDAKIVRLARVARQRAHTPHGGPAQGAAVRDRDGRTYAAATVEHSDPACTVSALAGALSAAYSSGARGFEALVLLAAPDPVAVTPRDRLLLAELAPGVPVLLADTNGIVVTVLDGRSAGAAGGTDPGPPR
ncbi:MAG TPA: cytidine deaminase [Mycobacteriales bacterium]|nr:cytidine deaminase [Mycobacteriales bacterium]